MKFLFGLGLFLVALGVLANALNLAAALTVNVILLGVILICIHLLVSNTNDHNPPWRK